VSDSERSSPMMARLRADEIAGDYGFIGDLYCLTSDNICANCVPECAQEAASILRPAYLLGFISIAQEPFPMSAVAINLTMTSGFVRNLTLPLVSGL